MARQPTPREYFLIGVLALAGVAVLYYNSGGKFGRNVPDDKEREATGVAPVIDLARLHPQPEEFDPNARNLFDFGPPPGRRAAAPPPPRPRPKPRPKPASRPKPPPQKPVVVHARPPQIGFAYLGYLGPKAAKIAVFEDGGDIMLARVGDVVQDEFRLVEFGYDKVVMGYTNDKFKSQTTELLAKAK